MRPLTKSRLSSLQPLLAFLIGLIGLSAAEYTKKSTPHQAYQAQLEAYRLMQECMEVLQRERAALGILVNPELDPNLTGLIGAEFTEITTSLGNLEAKRTSTNPEFAALMVRYFSDLGLQKGDRVAVGARGSFPGLILAVLSATRVLDLEPLVIYSVGSSMYGANLPEFTFIQMLEVLRRENLLPYSLLAVSYGGDEDRAAGAMLDGAEEAFAKITQGAGVPLISEPSVAASIQRRKELYAWASQDGAVACFVNVGGASTNYGTTGASLQFPNGLVLEPPAAPDHPEIGLVYEYARAGIPVIHLLNIRDLALKTGVAIDPVPFPAPGSGAVFYDEVYRPEVILLTLGAMVFCLAAFPFRLHCIKN